MSEILRAIAESMLGDITVGQVHYQIGVIILDHSLTIALTAIAVASHFKAGTNKSTKISTGILAASYVLSSAFLYAFSYLIDDAYKDYSLYLFYTFVNSLVVMCALFAHVYYRIRFSFSSEMICYMVLSNTFLQFFVCVVLFLFDKSIISYNLALELGAVYSISVNVFCWAFTLILAAPITSEALFLKVRTLMKGKSKVVTC